MSLSDSDGDDTVLVHAEDVQDFNSDNVLPLPAKEVAKITKWLQPTPYDVERSEYSRHRASHLLGTGTWLTSTQVYQQWHSGDNGLLWIKGIPGSGKSVMAASIIKQLQQQTGVPVFYFFFRQIIDANHNPIAALRDWLCQVLDYSPPLQAKLHQYLEDNRSLDSLSPTDLWSDLKLALRDFPKAYCVTDALDEMDPGNEDFLKDLVDLGRWRPENIKVLMTSRPIARLETSLMRPFSIPQIRLEERLVDLDIEAYVQYRLHSSSIAREDWSAIQEAIPGRANGIFLYAKMSMDVFLEPGADVQAVLNALPMDLNTMYNELLREHARRSNVPPDLQLLILQFVTHATRPLRLLEIAEMLNTRSDSNNRSLKETKDLVRAACGPLLEILPDETVSVIHHSLTEFLKGYTRSRSSDNSFEYPILEAGSTNLRLAMECLRYLRAGCLDNTEITKILPRESNSQFTARKEEKERKVRLQFPFLEYASNNWDKHAHRAEAEAEAEAEEENLGCLHDALDALFAETHRYNALLNLTWPSRNIEDITPLHVAARAGLAQFARHILSRRKGASDTESADLPISWAAANNHGDVIQVFIDYGADPDVESSEGLKPLHLAARSNHVDAVKALLAAGVSPLTPKTKEDRPMRGCVVGYRGPSTLGQTPLMYACHAGHLETVAEFVPQLNNNVDDLHRALHWAADKGRVSIVDLILQQPGVDVNVKLQGVTALFMACPSADLETIEVLLKAGADPNVFCEKASDGRRLGGHRPHSSKARLRKETSAPTAGRGYTALHALCEMPSRGGLPAGQPAECLKALLKAGADVHAMTPDGLTALHYAFKSSSVELIKPLLDAGLDPSAEDDAGQTALHSTSTFMDKALPVLLESGKVDINKPRAKDGRTPLLCRIADSMYHEHNIIDFLGYKPDVNATDLEGDSPLHLALQRTYLRRELIDALLAAGADPNLRNNEGNTPLHEMRNSVGEEIIKSIVQAGADLEVRNNKGQSVLFAQLSSRGARSTILDELASLGARLDTRDNKGRTLWHCALGNSKTLSDLQRLGVDPQVSDYDGNTPLHEAITHKSPEKKREVMKRLMEIGMNIDHRNHQGRTVLHVVCLRDDFKENHYGDSVYTILDYILGKCDCITVGDYEGIQPLHIAATVSETFVHKLLNAGADIRAATHDKMTALHLAARARQSGIIDMILMRCTALSEKARLEFVNSRDEHGRTALHYACRSGRPETVKSLLEAGAVCNVLDIHELSPLALCGEFEKEASLWDRRMPAVKSPRTQSDKGFNAGGLTLKDQTRPFRDRADDDIEPVFGRITSEHDTTRVAEIINLLVQYGADVENDGKSLEHAWKSAAHPGFGYTICCLPPLQNKSLMSLAGLQLHSSSHDPDWQLKISVAIGSRNAMKHAIEKSGRTKGEKEEKELSREHAAFMRDRLLENALALRYYDMFEKLSGETDILHVPDYNGSTPLNMLARRGFTEILDHICTREMATQLDGVNWVLNPDESNLRQCNIPLLISACERQLPNMDVLKLLVEKFGVNVNAKCTERLIRDRALLPSITRGVLHDLAKGKYWWHVDKALPYLIRMGADINIQNRSGETPLLIALNSRHPFSKEAFETLLEAGADVNVADKAGKTCLPKAGNDLNIAQRLIAHGAEVSPSAILSALDLEQVEMLEALLSHSGDSVLSQPLPTKIKYSVALGSFEIVGAGTLPLLYTAVSRGSGRRRSGHSSIETQNQLVDVLLKCGADPYATFAKQQYQGTDFGGSVIGEVKDFPVTTATVIHELLCGHHIVDPFFNLPSLDTERRDENGCTLLLAASKNERQNLYVHFGRSGEKLNSTDCFAELIKRGADVMAQDNEGRTILHHIGRLIIENSIQETLRTAMAANPGLIHKTDNANETALHHALRDKRHDLVQFLLDNGANPLQPDKNGDTALHHLVTFRHAWHQDLFERFLKAGVDINVRNNRGETPLFSFLTQNNGDSYRSVAEDETSKADPDLQYFLNSGADVFARRDDGSTLLHVIAGIKLEDMPAFQRRHPGGGRLGMERFKLLMEMGVDPMAEDKRQKTSVDVAAACENELILKLFKRKPME